jgi:Peptidase family M48
MLHRPGSILALCLFLLLFPGQVAVTRAAGPERVIPNPRDQQRIQQIVNEFMAKLNMAQKVAVAVVPSNPLMVSVEPDDSTQFLLSVEDQFIEELTQEELEAAIAHELGHVWIFTHHPFLQTEMLANQIAQRLVPRSSLVQVYEKVWKRQGTEGDLTRFVGD